MCKKCTDAVNEIFPDKPIDYKLYVLFNFTSFPLGGSEQVIEQLRRFKDVGEEVVAQEIEDEYNAVMTKLRSQEGKICVHPG